MYAVIKLAVEEAIKNSETIVYTFDNLSSAKQCWEEETKLMEEDVSNFPGSQFHKNPELFEATFEYEDFATKVQLVELKPHGLVVVNF